VSYIGKSPANAALTADDITDGIIGADKLSTNSVTTVKIADDAVGNTKLNLASDYAFTGTISGTPKGLTLLHTQTASGSGASSLEFTQFSSAYLDYRIYIDCLTPTGNSTNFYSRFKGPSGVITDSNYIHVVGGAYRRIDTDASGNTYNAGEGTFIRMNGDADLSNNDQYATNMIIDILNPQNTTTYKCIQWQSTASGSSTGNNYNTWSGSGWYKSTAAMAGINFFFNSGDIAVPTKMRLYGVTAT
tara:strand:- start:508 stop:1245 length:738 start_codon:yes stop_codon:yes gene_type:complete